MMTQNLSLNTLLDAVASPLLICQNNVILYANPTAEKLTGYSHAQLCNRDIDSLVYKTSSKAFTSWYAQHLVSSSYEALDIRLIPANQSLIWVKLTATTTLFDGKSVQLLTIQDITHLRQIETELYLSEAYRDILLINNPDLVMMTDHAGNLTYVSPTIQETLGYTSEDVLGQKWIEKIHPDDQPLTFAAALEVRQTNKSTRVEMRIRNHAGDYLWFEALVGMVTQRQNDKLTLISSIRNIHKHKLTEIALRERERRLSLITDNMQDIVLEINIDGLVRYLSPSCLSIMGYLPEDLIGKSHLALVHPDDIPPVLEYFGQTFLNPSPKPLDLRFRHKNGHFVWIEIVYKLVTDEAGELQSTVISAREISERKQVQEDLQQNRHLLQQIMDTVPAGIYLFDVPSNQSLFHNQKVTLGYSEAHVSQAGENFYLNLVHLEDRPIADNANQRLRQAKDGEVIISECRIKHADGEWRWHQFHDTVFARDVSGTPKQYLRTGYDITERKLAEEALFGSQYMLQQITDVAPVGIYIYDVKKRRDIYHNKRTVIETGIDTTSDTITEKFYSDYVHPEDAECHQRHQERLMQAKDGEIIESENRIRLPDGTYSWLNFRDVVFKRDEEGKPSQFLGSMQDITERKKVEQALHDSQNLLKQITATVPLDIYIYDFDLKRNIFFNRTQNMGYPLSVLDSQSLGDFYVSLVHPDDLELHRKNAKRLQSALDGELLHSEYRMKHASGEWHWYDFRDIVFARHADGTPRQFLGCVQDITARKEIEAELRQSRRMFQQVTETVPMQIFIYDYDLQRNIFENRPSDLGFDSKILANASESFFTNLVHPDDRVRHDEIMRQLQMTADGETLENEFRMRAADGTYAWRNYRYTPFSRRPDGSLCQFLGTILNVDERKKATEDLGENEEKLRLITDNIHDLVALTDENMCYRYVTPSHLQILGYTSEDLIGKSIFDLLHPDDLEAVQAKVVASIEKQQPDTAEFRYRHHDGYYLWMETNGSLALSPDGTLTGAIFASRDVSERRWMERAMLEQEKLLVMLQKEQELSSLKTRMMSRLSHELRTPLAIISTSADLLDIYGKRMTETQRTERLQQIKSQIKHFTSMLDNMALVVKGISYSMDFSPAPYNLELTATTVIEELKELLRVTHTVELHLQGDMSAVNSDEQLMRLILTHLLANALKYSPPTKPIIVNGMMTADTITIEVQDQGIGILPQEIERIFEPFVRGSNSGEIQGLGIGLSIVKDAITSMNGKVEIKSEVGMGTTVMVEIPLGGLISIN